MEARRLRNGGKKEEEREKERVKSGVCVGGGENI